MTVTIEDSGLDNDFATTDDNLTTTQTFDVTVNPVNDAPATTNKSFTTSEETPLTISAADLFAGSLGDVAPLAPSPQDESNQSFRVVEFDADGVVVTASNASAAPFATPHGQIDNIRFNSSGHLVDFVYTPDADFSSINGGSPVLDLFGFTVEDDGLAVDPNIGPDIPTTPLNVAATARIFVTSINDAPTLDALANVSIDEDGPLQSVTLSGVSAGGSEVQPVRITATSGDVSLIPDPTITYTSGDATGLLGFTPSADRYGTTTITVTVEDAGVDNDFGTVADNLTVTQTFVVTVNPVNDAPSTTDKSFSANEDTALTISAGQLIAQSSGHTDPQGPLPYDESNQLFQVIAIDADGVSVTGVNASSAPFGLTNGEITAVNFDTNGYLVDLVYTPNADSNLSDVFAFTVQDDGLALDPNNGSSVSTPPQSVRATASITVAAVNDAPTANDLADIDINEDDGSHTVSLGGITAGGGESQVIRVTATSSNSGLLGHPNVIYTSGDLDATLQFAAEPDQNGTTTITVTVTDGGLDNNLNTVSDNLSVTKTFEITVNPVNDAPSMALIPDRTINEDSGSQTITLSLIDAGVNETQTMEITATSDNPSLIAPPTVSYNGLGTTALLSLVPTSDSFGTATITVTLTDGGDDNDVSTQGDNLTFTETFVVTVNSIDDAPTVSPIADVQINEDSAEVVVTLSGVTPGPSETQAVRITATSNNTNLIANPSIVYTSPDTTGQLRFQPLSDRSGAAVIDVVIEDAGADGDLSTTSDNLRVTESFIVLVDAVNDQPTLDALADLTTPEDSQPQSVDLAGITAGGGESDPLRITATSSDPSLISNFQITYLSPNSTGQLSFTPAPNQFGSTTITVTVEDGGLDRDLSTTTDNGTFSQSFNLIVTPETDSPSFDTPSDQTIDEDSSPTSITITGISAGLDETEPLRVTATSSNQGLIPNPTVTYTSPADTAQLVLAPVADGFGSATIVLKVEDGGPDGDLDTLDDNQVSTKLFTVNVTNLPDSPQAIDDRFGTDENSVLRLSVADVLANDIDPDLGLGSNEVLSLNLTQTGLTNQGVAVIFDPVSGAIIYDPSTSSSLQALAHGETAEDWFTYSVTDADGESNPPEGTVFIDITGVNDAPVAVDDFVLSSAFNQPITIRPLSNDSDIDGTLDVNSLVITRDPVSGALSTQINAANELEVIFTPFATFTGVDEFRYSIADDQGQSSDHVIVFITPDPAPRTGTDLGGGVATDDIIVDVLVNDQPVTGQLDVSSLTIVSQPANGTATIQDGKIGYTANTGFIGTDSFSYTVADTNGNVSQPTTVQVNAVVSGLQNPILFQDVNANGEVTALDALLIINRIGRAGGQTVTVDPNDRGPDYFDVNGSMDVTSLDALLVINQIGRSQNSAEGEAIHRTAVDPAEVIARAHQAVRQFALAHTESIDQLAATNRLKDSELDTIRSIEVSVVPPVSEKQRDTTGNFADEPASDGSSVIIQQIAEQREQRSEDESVRSSLTDTALSELF